MKTDKISFPILIIWIVGILVISACSALPNLSKVVSIGDDGASSSFIQNAEGEGVRICSGVDVQAQNQFPEVILPFRVNGDSMKPTLPQGSQILVNGVAFDEVPPSRGDIVIAVFPRAAEGQVVKRVIGLPGENVKIISKQVQINSTSLSEPYLFEPADYQGEWVLGVGRYFLLGDNRDHSTDSHNFGPVTIDRIFGLVICVFES